MQDANLQTHAQPQQDDAKIPSMPLSTDIQAVPLVGVPVQVQRIRNKANIQVEQIPINPLPQQQEQIALQQQQQQFQQFQPYIAYQQQQQQLEPYGAFSVMQQEIQYREQFQAPPSSLQVLQTYTRNDSLAIAAINGNYTQVSNQLPSYAQPQAHRHFIDINALQEARYQQYATNNSRHVSQIAIPGVSVQEDNLTSYTHSRTPDVVKCMYCRRKVLTVTKQDGSCGSMFWCTLICCCGGFLGCCLIPLSVDSCQDIIHQCPNCGATCGRNEYTVCIKSANTTNY